MNRRNRKLFGFGIVVAAVIGGVACSRDKSPGGTPPDPRQSPQVQEQGAGASRIKVMVDGQGYHPASVNAPAGQSVQLEFTRTSDQTCGKEVVFPALNIRRDLPLNQPVAVDVTMPPSGSLAFTCGMDMFRGSVVAQ